MNTLRSIALWVVGIAAFVALLWPLSIVVKTWLVAAGWANVIP